MQYVLCVCVCVQENLPMTMAENFQNLILNDPLQLLTTQNCIFSYKPVICLMCVYVGELTNHIARELRAEHLLDVGPDLHLLPTTSGPQILHSCHLIAKPAAITEHLTLSPSQTKPQY